MTGGVWSALPASRRPSSLDRLACPADIHYKARDLRRRLPGPGQSRPPLPETDPACATFRRRVHSFQELFLGYILARQFQVAPLPFRRRRDLRVFQPAHGGGEWARPHLASALLAEGAPREPSA